MRDLILGHVRFEHLLCGLILLSRVGDLVSTYLVTPKLVLEANPVVRKLGWWYGAATLLVCLIPYASTAMGMIVLIPSLMVTAGNTGKIWFARAYGERDYHELLLQMARKTKLWQALVPSLVAALCIALIGALMVVLSPDPDEDWGFWFGFGFLAYAFAIGLHGSLFFIRLFRKAR